MTSAPSRYNPHPDRAAETWAVEIKNAIGARTRESPD
jgi:hypothetical protein